MVCPLSELAGRWGPAEAVEQIRGYGPTSEHLRHLSLSVQRTEGSIVGMRTRKGLSSLGSSDGVPEPPADVGACWRFSPLLGLGTARPWLWPGQALRWDP